MLRAMDAADTVRAILDANSYMTLSTADADGVPWATPVWFATENYRDLYWASVPDARHSRNLAVRPQLSIVVFDSTAKPDDTQAVYMAATATQVTDDVAAGIATFSRVSVRQGLGEWAVARVTGDARHRLYRATVTELYLKDPTRDIRHEVAL